MCSALFLPKVMYRSWSSPELSLHMIPAQAAFWDVIPLIVAVATMLSLLLLITLTMKGPTVELFVLMVSFAS